LRRAAERQPPLRASDDRPLDERPLDEDVARDEPPMERRSRLPDASVAEDDGVDDRPADRPRPRRSM
jgi:hypothetical protein